MWFERLFNGLQRADKTWIAATYKSQLPGEQQTRIHGAAAPGGGISVELLIKAVGFDGHPNSRRCIAPIGFPLRQPDARRNLAQAVCCRPAHDAGKRMHMPAASQFPKTGIRLIVISHGLVTHFLQKMEQARITATSYA